MKKNKDCFPIMLLLMMLLMIVPPMSAEDYEVKEINPDVVSISLQDDVYMMYMIENNHEFKDRTPLFELSNGKQASLQFSGSSFSFFENRTDNDYILYSTQSFDYETQPHRYTFTLSGLSGKLFVFVLNIINIDDEPPSMSCPRCSFDENTMYTLENSTCSCQVTDSDGFLAYMTFNILSGSSGREMDIFKMDFKETPVNETKTDEVYIYLTETLDYESISFYIFNIQGEDSAHHPTTPENTTAIINVNDMRDSEPVWTKVIIFEQFEEEEEQTFQVSARDGDVGLNKDICYKKVREDDEEAEYISIDVMTGEIHVSKIDRDKNDIMIYDSEISAYVCEETDWKKSQDMSFYIIDIDNNPPLVEWIFDSKKENISFHDTTTTKSTNLSFMENYAGSLNTTIFIRDIDTGENAQFTVELENLATSSVDYTDAFMVVPTAGYRSSQFQLSVRDATYLDYEVVTWQNIKFNVLCRGVKNPKFEDRLLVDITLINYNDEWPIFEHNAYTATISEAAKKGLLVTTVLATDRDFEDKVLKHTLIGSDYALQVLRIESGTGRIYVSADNHLDYDTVNPIFVQVVATDSVGHKATVPLTIYLEDVNNKAPTIDGGHQISVEENQVKGISLDSSITASDIDTTANLVVEINWSASYATKNSRRLDMTNETIAREVMFLDVKFTGESAGTYKNRSISIELIVNDIPQHPAPDYELFDNLFLNLIVTDLNTDEEFLAEQNTAAFIAISIIDINDNTPAFVELEGTNRTVQENAVIDTSPGAIQAIDLDVTDTVTYSCSAINQDTDWLEVNSNTGVFTVKKEEINADIPPTYFSNYSCTASDGLHTSDPLPVSFYIIDRNNRRPEIFIDETVHVLEQPDDNAVVLDMKSGISDKDRDEPFHTMVCSFSNVCNVKFQIVKNIIRVRNGKEIDRDTKEKNFTCSITCLDNPNGWRGEPSLSNVDPFQLTIIVDDINNFKPELDMPDMDCLENLKKGAKIHDIIGKDLDAGENGTIDFKVHSLINEDTGADISSIVSISRSDNDYVMNETHKRVHLMASEDLKGYYGNYIITFNLSDEGKPMQQQLQNRKFVIERYNFESPSFVFPDEENQSFQLLSEQLLRSPLSLFREPGNLQDFKIQDDSGNSDCTKWKIKFNITQLEPEDSVMMFQLVDKDPCTSQLQINDLFNSGNVLRNTYKMQIFAWIDGEHNRYDGEKPYYTNRNFSMRFYSNDQEPTFDESFKEWNIEFVEGKRTQSAELKNKATYTFLDDSFKIYYYMVPQQNETIESLFDVDQDSGKVSTKEIFYYDYDKNFQFQIVASNGTKAYSSNLNSYLDVNVEVLPANLRKPIWTRDYFFGAIMPGFPSSTLVISAEATDPDEIDAGNLHYSINGTIEATGNGLKTLSTTDAFKMNPDNGDITLNFLVETTMSGYFSFQICVQDHPDKYGNGPHENCTRAYIFIITSDKTVDFRFYNNVTDVQEREIEMLSIVSDIIGIQAYRQIIDKLIIDEGEYSKASLYFINNTFTNFRLLRDDSPVTAIDAQTILGIVSNVNTFSRLSSTLRKDTKLMLMSFPSTNTTSENLEATLKAWLIGVGIVLGALCCALLITFVLKIRQLNRRISKLTEKRFGSQESGLNRLGISAPTTNKHAIEGSNPVFNTNEIKEPKDMRDFDRQSIRSGDSDLIGVEDNPEFDYSFDKNHNDTTTYL